MSVLKEVDEVIKWLIGFKWTPKASSDINLLGGIEDATVENKIRAVKNTARCAVSYLKYTLNRKFVAWLGVFSGTHTNMMASKANPNMMPPVVFITDIDIDYLRHFAAGFGDYVEVKAPVTAQAPSNSMAYRTQSAIALMPTIRGHWWVFLLHSGKVVKREVQSKDVRGMSEEVMMTLNNLALQHPVSGDVDDTADIDAPKTSTFPDTDVVTQDPDDAVVEVTTPQTTVVLAEESGVETAVDNLQQQSPQHEESLVRPVENEHASAELELEVNEAPILEQPVATGGHVEVEPEPPPIAPIDASSTETQWRRRTLTRSLSKSTRSGRIYSSVKENLLFSAVGVLSVKKGLAEYGEEARKALIEEIENMLVRKVWTGVLRDSLSKRERKAIIRSHAFLKEKFSPSNVFIRLKARLVAMGNQQDRSLLYTEEETKSPTVAQCNSYVVLAIAANERRFVLSFDVKCAYLNANMVEVVIMELDPLTAAILVQLDASYEKFVDEKGKILVKLDKALYGCVESAKLWYEHFRGVLEKLGYQVNEYEPCVFNRWTESGVQSTVFFHVDDGLATCVDESELIKLQSELEIEFGELNARRGKVHEFLGLVLDFTEDGVCIIKAPKLIGEILIDFDITGSSKTPASEDLFDVDESSPLLKEARRRQFHSGVQKLLYIASRCRMDVCAAVSFLTTRVTKATEQDMKKFVRVLRYLNATKDLGLKLGGDAAGYIGVQIFADAAYGVHADAKSHSGISVTIGRGAVLVGSKKQRIVTKSSFEAELVTQSDSVSYGFRVLNFIKAQGYNVDAGIIYQDNQAAIKAAENGRSTSSRTRHINIRCYFLKQFLDSGELQVIYCPTDRMVADVLTKPLQGDVFFRLRDVLLGYDMP